MRTAPLAMVLALLLGASVAQAQTSRTPPPKRGYLVITEAIGTGAGGSLDGGTTVLQAMRVGGVLRVTGNHGVELSAIRLQTIFPASSRFQDLELSNPEGDLLILSYAALRGRRGSNGLPSSLSIGGGIARRQTAEAGRTRDTWAFRIGFDSDPFKEWGHLDAGVGANIIMMDARGNDIVYIAALGINLRIG